ncbi:hypothetical protein CHUAL_001830 [Chamberlinius hualienensis]
MLKIVALCLVLLGAEASVTFEDVLLEEFNLFKLQYGKTYKDREEEQYRMDIYINNRLSIASHNQRYHQGLVTFEMGMNKFGDLLEHEFAAIMNGFKSASNYKSKGSTYLSPSNVVKPDKIDWRTKGYVTPIKNQENCGSCWAFSATGALEGQTFRKTGKLVSLSEQNLVDCSGDEGNEGCGGGLMTQAFDYIKINHGIDTEESYPYEGLDDDCKFKKDKIGATDTGYTDIEKGNETQLQDAIATNGPISVAIDASKKSFQFYKQGVYYEPLCSSENLDHGVLAVGYDIDSTGQEYYIVKNSWGTFWGIEGYIWMSRNKNNNCGIATAACFPTV